MKPILLAFCLSLLAALPAFSADYYVSTAGSDSNPGTQAQPFATIQHAIDACPYTGGSSTVHLDGSTWNESPTLYANWSQSQPMRPQLAIIGDYNGPNGLGGRYTSIINGRVTVHAYIYYPGTPGFTSLASLSKVTAKGIYALTTAQTPSAPQADAQVVISECEVHNSNTYGIECFSNCGHITIDYCAITNSTEDGIYTSFPTFVSFCNITDNGKNGIYAYCGQISYLYDNTINNNCYSGIYILNGFNTVYNNTIHNNQLCGVYIEGNSGPDLGGYPGSSSSPGNNTISGNGAYEVYNASPNNIYAKNNHWDSQSEGEMAGGYYNTINVTRIWDKWEDASKGYVMWSNPGPTKASARSLGLLKATFYPSCNSVVPARKR